MRKRFPVLLLFLSAWGGLFAQEGARYLIITHDTFYNALQDLAQWKNQKGMKCKVIRLSEIGSNPDSIRNFVIYAYNNYNPRPEYLLLVGAPSLLPSYYNSTLRIYTDNYYANVSGDYRAELCYGRLPAKTASQCSVMVKKILFYEKIPTLADSFWLVKGVGIVNEDGSSDDTIYWNNVRFACQLMGSAGFVQVDTFSRLRGDSAGDVINAVNQGRGIVLYRGNATNNWYTPFNVNVQLTNNVNMLPIIASITCQTLTLSPNESMVGEAWLKVGSASGGLKGAVAFFGNTHSGTNLAPIRGVCTRGFFRTFFSDNYQLGKAVLAAKESIYARFFNQAEYEGFNLLGDPELNVLTGIPKPLIVEYPQSIRIGGQNITIRVRRENLPLANALVCLVKSSEVYAYGYTNSSGEITLNISPQTPGEMTLTCTGRNSLPFLGTIWVLPPSGSPYPVYYDLRLYDFPPNGNNNGKPNPGEEISLKILLKNIGDVPAYYLRGTLRTNDPNCQIFDSSATYGIIPPDSIRENEGYYRFRLSPDLPDGYTLPFSLFLTDTLGNNWQTNFSIFIQRGILTFTNYSVRDSAPGGNGNGLFEPGESGKLLFGLRNTGSDVISGAFGLLRSKTPKVRVIDSLAFFGNLLPGEEKFNNLTPFSLTFSPSLFGGQNIYLDFIYFGDGFSPYRDSVGILLVLGGSSPSQPIGPDPYGYYCYDNTDLSSGRAPNYNWVDIRSSGQLVPGATEANDTIVSLRLPFTFKYYGREYDTVSISSNGFFVMGRSTYYSGNNRSVPSPSAPVRGVFPFWDDLDTRRQQQMVNGEVYHYYDQANNRYIIMFWDCPHYQRRDVRETFEAILFDPRYYQTPTGDGEIVFQYAVVSDAISCTVGQQDHTETRGICYLYNNTYHPNAASLVSGRAIRLTTLPPVEQNTPWLTLERVTFDDTQGGNGNGILEPGESILLTVYLRNRGQASVNNLIGKLRRQEEDFIVLDSTCNFGTVAPNQEVNNSSSPYRFRISSFPSDTVLSFLLHLTGTNYQNSLFFTLGMGSFTGISRDKVLKASRKLKTFWREISEIKNGLRREKLAIYNFSGQKVEKIERAGIYFLKIGGKTEKIIFLPPGR
ncbi:MAG: C25 family cysteine peptidase [candidate division WOR-3 bacterium]